MILRITKKLYRISTAARGPQGPSGVNGDGPGGSAYAATSTSSLSIANSGSRTFTTQASLSYSAGSRVRASSGSNWMEGVCSSYSGTTLVVTLDKSNGSGTFNSWNLNIAGEPGAVGAQGPQGIQGPQGTQGADGVDGAVGPQGPAGADGATGAGYGGTSATPLSVGTGFPKIFTTQANLAWVPNQRIRAYSTGSGAYMDGAIASYNPLGTSLGMFPDSASGSGTHSDWVFFVIGTAGPQGPQGVPGNDGATGPQGPAGLDGSDGADGATGPQGPQGIQGIQGPAGAAGATGSAGATGPTGPAPSGDGLVSVTGGVLNTPTPLRTLVAADAVNLRSDLGFDEAVDDRVASLLVAGTNINFVYSDVSNTLTLNVIGGGGSVATDALFTTKGDIAVGTGASASVRLPAGKRRNILQPDPSEASGMKWRPWNYGFPMGRQAWGHRQIVGNSFKELGIAFFESSSSSSYTAMTSSNPNYRAILTSVTINTNTYIQVNNSLDSPFFGKRIMVGGIACLSSLSDVRVFLSLNSAGSGILSSDVAVNSTVAFRFSTSAGDSTWKAVVKDGSTENVQDTGVTPVAGTHFEWLIECDPAVPEVRFYLDGVLVYTHTTNLPVNGVQAFLTAGARTLVGAAYSFRYSDIFIFYDRL